MESLVNLLLSIVQKTENKHYVLLKNVSILLLNVSIASLIYQWLHGPYKIEESSWKSLLVFFDNGNFWLFILSFLASCLLFAIMTGFAFQLNKGAITKSRRKLFGMLWDFRNEPASVRFSFQLMEDLFFETSRFQNVIGNKYGVKMLKSLFRRLNVIKIDEEKHTCRVDKTVVEDFASAIKETEKNGLRGANSFISDLMVALCFLAAILFLKEVGSLIAVLAGLIPLLFLLRITIKVLGFLSAISTRDFEVALAILNRICVSRNDDKTGKVTVFFGHNKNA